MAEKMPKTNSKTKNAKYVSSDGLAVSRFVLYGILGLSVYSVSV